MVAIRKSHPKSEFATISTKSRYSFCNLKNIVGKEDIIVLQIAINPDGDGIIEYVNKDDYNSKTSDIGVCPICGADMKEDDNEQYFD